LGGDILGGDIYYPRSFFEQGLFSSAAMQNRPMPMATVRGGLALEVARG
jgi:hypothetical protein